MSISVDCHGFVQGFCEICIAKQLDSYPVFCFCNCIVQRLIKLIANLGDINWNIFLRDIRCVALIVLGG